MSTATTSRLAESSLPSTPFWSTPRSARYAASSPTCRRRSGRSRSRASRISPRGGWAGWVPRPGASWPAPPTVAPQPRGPPVHRCRLGREPAAEAAGPALPGRRTDRRAAGDRRRPRAPRPQARAVLPGEPHPGGRSQQRPAGQPGLGQGGHRHRGVEPGARGQAAGDGPGLGTAHSGDGRRQRLRRGREHRRDAGRGRVSQRGAGADPVRAADRRGLRGADAGGPAHDQQVLRASTSPRNGAWSSTASGRAGRCSSSPGATRTRGTPPGTSTPTCAPSWTPSTPWRRSPAARRRCSVACAPAASSRASQRPTSPASAGRTGWPRSAWQ